jgi:RNA-directed DNA polymerase
MQTTRPFRIPKQQVVQAYKLVKANKGSFGIDGESLQEFDKKLKNNLYKIWNRMSSGSYFPPAVREVPIPKDDGKMRMLGIPTVSDRIAQAIVKMNFEPALEPIFHKDSYGYRPGKSALDAVKNARDRCWKYGWVIDLDIKGFFDNIDHELMMKAVRKHTSMKWIILYIERWLKASIVKEDGTLIKRGKGTPQGGVISPLLANLFLHYALDKWIERRCSRIEFERYADDVIIHCASYDESRILMQQIEKRLEECKLELNKEKTKIVYCKQENRKEMFPTIKFDFLGYTFRPRLVRTSKGKYLMGFTPAVSNKSKKKFREKLRSLKVKTRTSETLSDLSKLLNPIIRGWLNYFTVFGKGEIYYTVYYINQLLIIWASKKYKSFRRSRRKARKWLSRISNYSPDYFVHWKLGMKVAAGR